MWVFTVDGFFSVVHDGTCKPDEIMVRAWKKEDLERLGSYMELQSAIVEIKHADYHYQMPVKREIWAEYLRRKTLEIDYRNFRETISYADYDRHQAYFECWRTLYRWHEQQS